MFFGGFQVLAIKNATEAALINRRTYFIVHLVQQLAHLTLMDREQMVQAIAMLKQNTQNLILGIAKG